MDVAVADGRGNAGMCCFAEGMFKGFGKSIPAGRSGEPADLGNAVLFLLTNNFMTGCILDVDGGKTL